MYDNIEIKFIENTNIILNDLISHIHLGSNDGRFGDSTRK
jgi:hypothetical protein